MAVGIYPIELGVARVYVLKGEGVVLIDGGPPKRMKSFVQGLERASIAPDEIELIIITHGHWDHIGSAKPMRDLTGAKIAMHGSEKECLEKSLKRMPPGVTPWGRILSKALDALLLPFVEIPPAEVDLVLDDGEFPLVDHGIPGKVVHSPGHSPGSVSVLLETGEAFVGDLAMNAFPLRLGPGLPIFGEDTEMVKESWRMLMQQGAKTVYPAHGDPFPVEVIREALR